MNSQLPDRAVVLLVVLAIVIVFSLVFSLKPKVQEQNDSIQWRDTPLEQSSSMGIKL